MKQVIENAVVSALLTDRERRALRRARIATPVMAAMVVGSLAVAVWARTDARSKIASANESCAEAVKYVDECRAITKSAVESEAAARAERDSLKSALEKRDAEWVSGVQKLNADSRAGFPATR